MAQGWPVYSGMLELPEFEQPLSGSLAVDMLSAVLGGGKKGGSKR